MVGGFYWEFWWKVLHFQYANLLIPKDLSEKKAKVVTIFSIDVETEAERN